MLYAEVNGAPSSPTAGITLFADENPPLGFKLGPPTKPIRFSVGQPGRRSSVWRVWANKNKSDVYIASRFSVKLFKISLHESGDWRMQWIDDKHKGDTAYLPNEGNSPPEGRVMARWSKPPEEISGWTDALSIWVPGKDITEVPGDHEKGSESQWINEPSATGAIEFRFMLVTPRMGKFNLSPALKDGSELGFVNGFRLANGEVLLIFAATVELDEKRREDIEKLRSWIHKNRPDDFDVSPETGPRCAVEEVGQDGRRSFWDLSLRHG
ncbi:hypothetical protein ACOQFL_19765 [Actinopolyspora sp. H202]|uniref:hypothetical protein n=1 Tax=Actinopolyspora sp. H202 TaxID=1500456 RepID=UPI003EE6B053